MVNYEMMLMLYPDLGEKGTKTALKEITELLASFDGKITEEDVWGVRDLAYTIKKQDQGYYLVWLLQMPGKHISEFEKALNINPQVMRYLITKTPVNYELVSVDTYEAAAEAEREKAQAEKEEKAVKKAKPRPKKTVKKSEVKSKLDSIIDDPDLSL